MNKKEQIREFIERIEHEGILTGSRALGFETAFSDWDYIVPEVWYDKSLHFLNTVDIYIGRYPDYNDEACGKGFYFKYGGKTYNLICLSHTLLKHWVSALEMLKSLKSEHDEFLADKTKRKQCYQDLVNALIDLHKK